MRSKLGRTSQVRNEVVSEPINLIAYYRVSTQRQGRSGLGLEAQQAAVEAHAARIGGKLLASYTEIESGRKALRPELVSAIRHAKGTGSTLVVAKLDRLSRDARFLLEMLDAGLPIFFCDLPEIGTSEPVVGRLFLTMMAAIAEFEARRISQRIKEALAAYKARGGKLGRQNPRCRGADQATMVRALANGRKVIRQNTVEFRAIIRPVIQQLRSQGRTLRQTADEMNRKGYKTRRGKPWTLAWVSGVMNRFEWE